MKHSTKCLLGYLKSWYFTSTQKQRDKGHYVDLTFGEFLNLFDKKQLRKLRIALMDGTINNAQNEANEKALVLTWRSYAARSTCELTNETAYVCTRAESAKVNQVSAGDTLRDDHKGRIKESLKGVPKSADHRASISAGCKGVSKRKWTEEEKLARSVLRKAQEAAKRAAK